MMSEEKDQTKGTAVVEIENLSLGFSAPVFEHISLRLNEGQALTIMGENGSGKTLLFNALLGLKKPLKGKILIFGNTPSNCDQRKLHGQVGWVTSQHEDFPPGLSIAKYFQCVAPFYARWDWDLLEKLSEKFSLDRRKKVTQLSLGESSKVRLVRALAQRPRLLVLDELTSNLSPKSKKVVMAAVVSQMSSDGLSLLSFSHVEDEAKRVSDRVVVLSRQGLVPFIEEPCNEEGF